MENSNLFYYFFFFSKSHPWKNSSNYWGGFSPFPSTGSGVKTLIKFIPLLLLPLPPSTLNNSSPSLVFTAFKYLQTVVMSHSSSPPFLVVSLVSVTYLALLIFLSKSIPLGPDRFCSSLSNSSQLVCLDLTLEHLDDVFLLAGSSWLTLCTSSARTLQHEMDLV